MSTDAIRDFSLPEGIKAEPFEPVDAGLLIGVNYDLGLINILSKVVFKYTNMMAHYVTTTILPAEVLTPDHLAALENLIQSNSNFYIESLDFLDTLSMLDIMVYGGTGDGVVNLFMASIKRSRASGLGNSTNIMSSSNKPGRSLTRNKKEIAVEELLPTLESKRELLSYYIYSQICSLINMKKIAKG